MLTVYTASQLIQEVRDQLNEYNIDSISNAVILRVLSRANDSATTILAKCYPDQVVDFMGPFDAEDMTLPLGLHEDRINKVEYTDADNTCELRRISYRERTKYLDISSGTPLYYYMIKNELRFLPTPTRGTVLLWYVPESQPFVEDQGRILQINSTSKYLVLTSLGSELTVEEDDLKNYFNIVSQTGEIKATMQIERIDTDDNFVYYKVTPDLSEVFGLTVVGTLPSDVVAHDFICSANGTCVSPLKKTARNFMLQFAVVELKRRMGEPTEAEERTLSKLEKELETTWVKREVTTKIVKRSKIWR